MPRSLATSVNASSRPMVKACWRHYPDVLPGRHFGPVLITYILYQYHHNHVTQPLLQDELAQRGIVISTGQINRILTEDKQIFHEEKAEVLTAGLTTASY